MNRLLESADPARGVKIDSERLRAKVDERIGLEPIARPLPRRSMRPWAGVATGFAVVLAIAIPTLLNVGESAGGPPIGAISDLPGVESVIPLASGGVQTMAIDGDDVWVVTALQSVLQRVSMISNQIVETFPIDGHVEGVISGNGYLWLLSYDNGGEVLRFEPDSGSVDRRIPLRGAPTFGRWFGERLFVGNDQGELVEISPGGELLGTTQGWLKGDGLGYLWLFDQEDGSLRSMSEDGTVGDFTIPENSEVLGGYESVRQVGAAGGYLWLIFGDYSESVVRFDPTTSELVPLHVGRWLHSLTEHDNALWMTSYSDGLLFEVDPETGAIGTYALPGQPGGVESVDGDLWVLLNQPGSLLRIDPSADLVEMGPVVASLTSGASQTSPHNLTCTLGGVDSGTLEKAQVDHDFTGLGPTVVMEGPSWISGGIWSVVQAQIDGQVVCVSGHTGDAGTAEQRAADLGSALERAGIPGPYELVAAGDGVHTVRLFAQGREDVRGVLLVEPMPIGFQDYYDDLLGEDFGHPNWLDLDRGLSDSLAGFGDVPLVILGHEPDAVFLNDRFVDTYGEETAQAASEYWEEGLDYYAGLSTESHRVTVSDTGFEGVLWFRPDLILKEISSLANGEG